MAKLTILYGHPQDPDAFERYYSEQHLPFAQQMPDVVNFELTRVLETAGGGKAPYYRIAEMWWDDITTLTAALGSEDGQAVLADMDNFVTGGATLLISEQPPSP